MMFGVNHRRRHKFYSTDQVITRIKNIGVAKTPARDLVSALAASSITDAEGLSRAYSQGDTYARGDTLYIAGSHTAKDWYDDFTKVPFYGDLRNATRYQAAEKALKTNPNIRRVVGHSLGGAVALELQKQYPQLKSRTYGAPVWDPFGTDRMPHDQWVKLGKPSFMSEPESVERYRNLADPVSIFDGSATNSIKGNPFDSFSLTHDYGNIAAKFRSGNTDNSLGWKNDDGSISLTQ
jgi:pimeloyl-ACP methyl ester carboxylesterase